MRRDTSGLARALGVLALGVVIASTLVLGAALTAVAARGHAHSRSISRPIPRPTPRERAADTTPLGGATREKAVVAREDASSSRRKTPRSRAAASASSTGATTIAAPSALPAPTESEDEDEESESLEAIRRAQSETPL